MLGMCRLGFRGPIGVHKVPYGFTGVFAEDFGFLGGLGFRFWGFWED